MNFEVNIKIEKSAEYVWDILEGGFDKASEWMSVVPRSYAIEEGPIVEGAKLAGRVCELNFNGTESTVDERITKMDQERKSMTIEVVPRGGKLPINKNEVVMSVRSTGAESSEVTWSAETDLTLKGKIISPILKQGLKKNFNELLEELKFFVETGKPHPRKVKALGEQAA